MIKWLKCLLYGHSYGKFVGYVYNASKNISCPRMCRYCKKCNEQHIFKLEEDNDLSFICGYANSVLAREIAQKYADKFNNSIE